MLYLRDISHMGKNKGTSFSIQMFSNVYLMYMSKIVKFRNWLFSTFHWFLRAVCVTMCRQLDFSMRWGKRDFTLVYFCILGKISITSICWVLCSRPFNKYYLALLSIQLCLKSHITSLSHHFCFLVDQTWTKGDCWQLRKVRLTRTQWQKAQVFNR
jgi:hypothetical protein